MMKALNFAVTKLAIYFMYCNKVAGFQASNITKKDSNTGVFRRILRNLQEQPPVTASETCDAGYRQRRHSHCSKLE